jgi:FkbM family methyltransferase
LHAALKTAQFLWKHPLTRSRPWVSLVRYARWQLSSRLAIGPTAVSFVDGSRLLVHPGMTGATGNIYAGLHEFEDMAFALHALRPDDVFADVGANIGSYTVLASKVVGAKTIAFEPIASTFAHLRDNIALNFIGSRVDARQVCVGAEVGAIAMTSQLDTVNHVVDESDSGASALVSMTTLDDALAGVGPFLIKLDVEGYEAEVVRGAAGTLANPALQCLIVELSDGAERYGSTDSDVIESIEAHGFTRCVYDPEARRLEESSARRGSNVIFVRDRALVQSRLRSARTFQVLDTSI